MAAPQKMHIWDAISAIRTFTLQYAVSVYNNSSPNNCLPCPLRTIANGIKAIAAELGGADTTLTNAVCVLAQPAANSLQGNSKCSFTAHSKRIHHFLSGLLRTVANGLRKLFYSFIYYFISIEK